MRLADVETSALRGWTGIGLAVVVIFIGGSHVIANAAEPQVGRWAADVQHCDGSGDTMKTAPLTVTANSLRRLSEYCSIGKMYKAERALYIEGRCSNRAGLMVRHAIKLAMKGERLAVTWNGEHTEMRRCP